MDIRIAVLQDQCMECAHHRADLKLEGGPDRWLNIQICVSDAYHTLPFASVAVTHSFSVHYRHPTAYSLLPHPPTGGSTVKSL